MRVRGGGAIDELKALQDLVSEKNACALPGCTIKFDPFMVCLRRAQSRGYVKDAHADFVADGLKNGFSIGLQRGALRGRRIFNNYPSAYVARESVSDAIQARVGANKTLCIGTWSEAKPALDAAFDDYFCFPMGAVPKPHQPDVMRPTSDHTRTGLNAASVIDRHSLDTYNEISWYLKQGYFMRVSDVADAFLLIPLAPWLWPFFLFRWYASSSASELSCFVHLFGDFGTRGLPGTFKVFLVDVIVQMARSEMVLTLPIAIYVDDSGLIGPDGALVDQEALNFHDWSLEVCGVGWKVLKERPAAQLQFMIGFWWDSRDLTRRLDDERREKYAQVLQHAARARVLTLRERQRVAGRAQRAVLTFPPGASCLLTTCYIQMRGLKLLMHARRTTRAERVDYQFIHDLLQLNLGCGYYSYAGFKEAPCILSDASHSRKFSGGGWVSADGSYDFFVYKGRQLIDYKEGDTVLRACEYNGPKWHGCIVPFGIDNSVIERSIAKGRSGVERLNELMRHLFIVQQKFGFVLAPFWISSEDNFLADHLSRDREDMFLLLAHTTDFLRDGARPIFRVPGAGRVVSCDRPNSLTALRQLLDGYSSNSLKDGPSRGAGVGGDAQLLSLQYSQSSIYDGLPVEYLPRLEQVLDNRLAPSSRAHVDSALKRWSVFSSKHGWEPLLADDDKGRGGKMASWVLCMVDETELSFKSIVNYIWGMRTWQQLQGNSDPAMGVRNWRELMRAVAVLTAVPSEPREQVPLPVLRDMLQVLSASSEFQDIQLHLVLLVLLFTFSRTECPCPKAWTGPNVFDPQQHWQVADFRLMPGANGQGLVLWVRFKRIKQDPRVERAPMVHSDPFVPSELTGDGGFGRDWVPLGDVPGDELFSVARAFMRFVRAVGRKRPPSDCMFLARDKVRCYTYSCLTADFKRLCDEVGCSQKLGPHGLRVLGYNLSKLGNGVDLTVAHGGWSSEAHSRYERFSQQQVLGVPAGMLGVASQFTAQREVTRDRAKRGAGAPLASPGELLREFDGLAFSDDSDGEGGSVLDADEPPRPTNPPPPGYRREDYAQPSGRAAFKIWTPDGTLHFRTLANAWSHYGETDAAGAPAIATNPAVAVPAPATPNRARVKPRASPRASSVPRERAGSSAVSASPSPTRPSKPPAVKTVAQQPVEHLEDAVVEWRRPPQRRFPTERQRA